MRQEDTRKNFANNLKQMLAVRGMRQTELAEAVGVPKQTVSNWCHAVSMPKSIAVLDKVCEVLTCGRDDLLGASEGVKQRTVIRIPVLGRVPAGVPLEAIEDITDYEELDPKKFSPDFDYFALTIHGDSMEPKMSEGDVVIVRKQDDAESGDICIVRVNGSDATCKRVRKYRDGIELISLNPSYGPMYFSSEQVESYPVRIIGKVVELRAKF